jgi:hypothetical protein
MADDGTTESWIRFLADSFSNLSWLIQDDKNKKLFQDCAAKIKTQIAWLKTSKCHPWFQYFICHPRQCLYGKDYGMVREMSSFYLSIFELLNKRWFNFQKMSTNRFTLAVAIKKRFFRFLRGFFLFISCTVIINSS